LALFKDLITFDFIYLKVPNIQWQNALKSSFSQL